MPEQIILKYYIGNLDEFEENNGLKEFIDELKKHGWADEEGKTRGNFTVLYSCNLLESRPYAEWRAIKKDKLPEGFGDELLKRINEIEKSGGC